MKRRLLLLLLGLAAAGCSKHQGNIISIANSQGFTPLDNAAAPAANETGNAAGNEAAGAHEQVLRRESVTGTFAGWEMGDYLWAHIQVPGRETISAQPGPSPIDLFLDANRGRTVTVEVATVRARLPEASSPIEIRRITAARNATTTAEAWWQGLSAADRAAAQRRFEQGPLSHGQ